MSNFSPSSNDPWITPSVYVPSQDMTVHVQGQNMSVHIPVKNIFLQNRCQIYAKGVDGRTNLTFMYFEERYGDILRNGDT